jgi:hypothetical protein
MSTEKKRIRRNDLASPELFSLADAECPIFKVLSQEIIYSNTFEQDPFS